MSKDKEIEMVDFRVVEVDLMEKVADLTILCKTKEKPNGRIKKKERPSGKEVIPIDDVLVLTKAEVILTKVELILIEIAILEEVFMVIVSSVVQKDIEPLSVNNLVNLKVIIEML